MMRPYLIAFLKALESAIPPPQNCHHCITYAQYGSEERGFTEQLAVQVNNGGLFSCFFLDDDDCEKHPEHLAREIAALMASPPPNAQYGPGVGQYFPPINI